MQYICFKFFSCLSRLSMKRENLSAWLAQDGRPGPTVPLGRPTSGPSSLLALWSRADTTTNQPAPAAEKRVDAATPWLTPAVASADASRQSAAPPAELGDFATWLASAGQQPATAVQPADNSSQTTAAGSRDTSTWLLAPAAAKSPAPQGPVNLLANWSWQPEHQPDALNINIAKLSLVDPPVYLQDWLVRAPTPSDASAFSSRGSHRYVSGSESSEIMILDAENDENIDFPEDQDF
jgi:hypothetical protein